MTTTPRPAYIWDANSNDWAPLAGTVDTGQSYNFSAVENFNAGLTATSINGGGITGQNHLINGGMDVWQRGTSFSIGGPGTVIYSADRWTCYSGNTGTITRDTSLVPDGFESSLKFTSTINNSGIDFYQLIETKNVIPLRGKTVTLSAYVAGTNGKTAPGMTAYYSTTNDDMIYLTSGVLMQNISIPAPLSSTSFQRISMTFTVPVTARTIRIGLISSTLNNTEFINWAGVKLEVGTIATAFSRVGGTIASELSSCQRYYWRNSSDTVYQAFGAGFWEPSSSIILTFVDHPVVMRVMPISIDYAGPLMVYDGATGIGVNSISIGSFGSKKRSRLNLSLSSSATANRPYELLSNASTAPYIGFSAEL